jgi:hypothetical protein
LFEVVAAVSHFETVFCYARCIDDGFESYCRWQKTKNGSSGALSAAIDSSDLLKVNSPVNKVYLAASCVSIDFANVLKLVQSVLIWHVVCLDNCWHFSISSYNLKHFY